jgi:hypothetical protein
MSMLSLKSNSSRTKKTPRLTPLGLPGGCTHRVRSRAPSGEETRPSLTTPRPSLALEPWGSWSTPTLLSGPWLLPSQQRQPRPGHKKTRPELPRLGGSTALPLGHGIAGHFPDKVTHGAWHKKTKFSCGLQGIEDSWPARQPLEPTSFAAKQTPESPPGEAGPSRHSLTRRVSEQSSRTTLKGLNRLEGGWIA